MCVCLFVLFNITWLYEILFQPHLYPFDYFYRKQDILDKTLGAIPEDSWSPDAVQQIRDEIKTFILAGI